MDHINVSQAMFGLLLAVSVGLASDASARRLGYWWSTALRLVIAGAAGTLIIGTAWIAHLLGSVQHSTAWIGSCVLVLVLSVMAIPRARRWRRQRGWTRRAVGLIGSRVRSERHRGYALIAQQLDAGDDLPTSLVSRLRSQICEEDVGYESRANVIQLLRRANALDGLRAALAVEWFGDPALPEHYSSVVSAVFADRREDLDSLLCVLEDQPLPSYEFRNDGVATAGYRLSQAFGSIRSAIQYGRDELSTPQRERVLSVSSRFESVQQLAPLITDVRAELQ